MGFWQENRFKIRQAFAAAAAGIGMAVSLTTVPPRLSLAAFLIPLSLYAGFCLWKKRRLTTPSKDILVPDPDSPIARLVDDAAQQTGIAPPKTILCIRKPQNAMHRTGILMLDWRDFHPDSACPQDEIKAVIAHELAHKKNKDNLKTNLMAVPVLASALGFLYPAIDATVAGKSLAVGQTMLNTALTASSFLLLAYIARQNEYEADRNAVRVMGSGKPLRDYLSHDLDRQNYFFKGPAVLPLSAMFREKGWASGETLIKINGVYDAIAGPAVRAWRKLASDHPQHEERFKSIEQEERLIQAQRLKPAVPT